MGEHVSFINIHYIYLPVHWPKLKGLAVHEMKTWLKSKMKKIPYFKKIADFIPSNPIQFLLKNRIALLTFINIIIYIHILMYVYIYIWLSARWQKNATLVDWLSGWVGGPVTLNRVAEWLSGWCSHSSRVTEWLLRFLVPHLSSILYTDIIVYIYTVIHIYIYIHVCVYFIFTLYIYYIYNTIYISLYYIAFILNIIFIYIYIKIIVIVIIYIYKV